MKEKLSTRNRRLCTKNGEGEEKGGLSAKNLRKACKARWRQFLAATATETIQSTHLGVKYRKLYTVYV
jgi:hypothetical protein